MLRIKVREIGEGQHPSEVMVEVTTADGAREGLIVDRRSISDGTLGVGYPVGMQDDRFLVELPRETLRGSWRLWVARDAIVEKAPA